MILFGDKVTIKDGNFQIDTDFANTNTNTATTTTTTTITTTIT